MCIIYVLFVIIEVRYEKKVRFSSNSNFLIVCSLIACNSDKVANGDDDKIIGEYQTEAVTGLSYKLTMKEDKKYSMFLSMSGINQSFSSGTYTLNGEKLTLKDNNDILIFSGIYKNDIITLTIESTSLKFQKETSDGSSNGGNDDENGKKYTGGTLTPIVYGDDAQGRSVGTAKIEGSGDNIIYALMSGSLPLGISIGTDGMLSGNAWDEPGIYSFAVLAAKLDNGETAVAMFTLTVNKAELTITANNKSRTYGNSNPSFDGTITGFKKIEGLDVNDITGNFSFTCEAMPATNAGTVEIIASEGTAVSKKYSFRFISGTLTINKASLTIKADDKQKQYGQIDPVYTAAAVDGLKNGQTLADVGTIVYTVAGALTGVSRKPGSYVITPSLSIASANYNITFQTGTLKVTAIFMQIAASSFQSFAIDSDGNLWAWGDNAYGQLGLGDQDNRTSPTKVGERQYKKVVVGYKHTFAIDSNDNLWAWGNNTYGQLGLGDKDNRTSPEQVGVRKYRDVVTATYHSLAIDMDSNLWAWGENDYGQLGLGDNANRTSPMQVGGLKYNAIAAGMLHSLAIDTDGYLWAWGGNTFGQLGLGDNANRAGPVQVGGLKYKVIAAGSQNSHAIDSNDNLWAWGDNYYGQLGLGDKDDRMSPVQVGSRKYQSISEGYRYVLAIDTDGNLWACGSNDYGQLGLDDNANRTSPVQVGSRKYKTVAAGNYHSLAIDTDGNFWVWGGNTYGQLGLGNTINKLSPTLFT